MSEDKLGIYLGIPYSKVDKEESFYISSMIAMHMIKDGYLVYSPITYSHMLHKRFGGAEGFDQWSNLDLWQIKNCGVLAVIKMEGWQESTGLLLELEAAEKMGKRIMYIGIDEMPHAYSVTFPRELTGEEVLDFVFAKQRNVEIN